MYEPGDIFAGADMTRYELATLDRLMFEAQQVGGAVWPGAFWSGACARRSPRVVSWSIRSH